LLQRLEEAGSLEVGTYFAALTLAYNGWTSLQALTICSLEGGHDSRSIDLKVIRRPVFRIRINTATSTSQKAAISCDFFNKVSFRLLSLSLRLLEMWAIVSNGIVSGLLQIKYNRTLVVYRGFSREYIIL
jgi:hypothetical protein